MSTFQFISTVLVLSKMAQAVTSVISVQAMLDLNLGWEADSAEVL
jgi:hypothetical protein